MSNEHDLRTKIIAKAWKDPEFKERLLNNPKAAFKECGYEIPENVNVKVIEDSANSYTFVIPHGNEMSAELSEEELLKLSGGDTSTYCNAGCITA